ncbi:hypothetical protein ABEB36_009543 [Hypothenemus hampei]|uniref:Uncharacterized protein n=1 Tax=Hypothenemus hampei TaxID=57062 RepID=A0ABD1EGM8_HYPHA
MENEYAFCKVKKRKRTKNTTTTQYEIYLDVMERDYAFRSNTIDPTLPRFMDWKYATKAKIRKINAHRKKTGGVGPI